MSHNDLLLMFGQVSKYNLSTVHYYQTTGHAIPKCLTFSSDLKHLLCFIEAGASEYKRTCTSTKSMISQLRSSRRFAMRCPYHSPHANRSFIRTKNGSQDRVYRLCARKRLVHIVVVHSSCSRWLEMISVICTKLAITSQNLHPYCISLNFFDANPLSVLLL